MQSCPRFGTLFLAPFDARMGTAILRRVERRSAEPEGRSIPERPEAMPVTIDTTLLRRCLDTLESALREIARHRPDSIAYDIYRAACVKEFDLVLEQSGKLLRKRLRPWFASNLQVDRLAFKDVFRHAAKCGLIDTQACERWLRYRDNRNDTAHDYGAAFAETTLKLLPGFLADSRALADLIEDGSDD